MPNGNIKEPEDIFADTDSRPGRRPVKSTSAAKPARQVAPTTSSAAKRPAAPVEPMPHEEHGRRRFLVSAAILGIVVIAGVALVAWRNNWFTSSGDTINGTVNMNAITNTVVGAGGSVTNISPINTAGPTDTDGDGLSDAEEQSLGTDMQKADTDGDGLFDREEVKVYKTDSLKKDTDGDGIDDGTEVKNGYNPAGGGKLYDLNTAINNSNQ